MASDKLQGFQTQGITMGVDLMKGPLIDTTKDGHEEFLLNSQRSVGSYEEDHDFNIDILQKQNNEMKERLQMGSTVTVNSVVSGHVHSGDQLKFSYGSYLEEQEQRHSKQIETLYRQISQKDTQYSAQITQLQHEKAQLEQRLMIEISSCREMSAQHQVLIQEKEFRFQEQETARLSELTSVRHDLELVRSQHSDLEQSYSLKQEQIRKYEIQIKDLEANYQIQIETLQSRLQEYEKKWFEREEEFRLSQHYREKAEAEVARYLSEVSLKDKKILEKNKELESLQKRIVGMEAESSERVEHVKRTTQNTLKLQEQKITQALEEKIHQQVTEIEQRYKMKLQHQEKTHQTAIKQAQSEVESSKLNDKKLQFDLKSAHQQYRALQINIEQKDQSHLTEKSRLEKHQEELRMRLDQTTQDHQSALDQLQDQKKLQQERQVLLQAQKDLEQKLAESIQNMFKKQNEIARERGEKQKELEGLKLSINERDRTLDQQSLSFKEQLRAKDQQLQRFSEELQAMRIESEQNETKLRAQIQRLSTEIQELKEKYEVRIQSLNCKIQDIQQAAQLEAEANARNSQEAQKAYLLEITSWKGKLSELQMQAKQEVRRLVEKKTYLENQRNLFNSEIKKLFGINAELEKKLADARIELHAYSGQNELISHATLKEKEAIMLTAKEQEQMTISKIQEIQMLRDKISKMEQDHAISTRILHDQISEQEKRYSDKVQELQSLEAENADLQVLATKSSQSIMMRHKVESQTLMSSHLDIEKYKEINENLEQHFNQRLHELQEKHALYESRETHFLGLVKQFEVQRQQLQEGYALKEQELKVKMKNFEATHTSGVSLGSNEELIELNGKIEFLEAQCQAYIEQISLLKQAQTSQEQELERQRAQSYQAMSKSNEVIQQYYALQQSQSNVLDESSRIKELEALQEDYDLCEEKLGNLKEQVGEYKKIETVLREQLQSFEQELAANQKEIAQLQAKVRFLSEENRILTERINLNQSYQFSNDSRLGTSFRTKYSGKKGSLYGSKFTRMNQAYAKKSLNNSQSSIGEQQVAYDTAQWYTESLQAKNGYEMSNTNAYEQSISNIEKLLKKPTHDLEALQLISVEWSTSQENNQAILSSIKFNFSDGSSTQEWGFRNYSTYQIYKFQNSLNNNIAEIRYEASDQYILYISFYDSHGGLMVSCGGQPGGGPGYKTLLVKDDFKIVYIYGASSSYLGSNVGMIGFDFWYCKPQMKVTDGASQAFEEKVKMVPDGFYKAQWESGKESNAFEVYQGKYTLNGKQYQLLQIEGQIRFEWNDGHGTVQQLGQYQSDGSINWKVFNNPQHKKVIWTKIVEKEQRNVDLSGLYEIHVYGGTDASKTVLGSKSDGLIELTDKATSSRHLWWLEKLDNGLYHIKMDGHGQKLWLSASPDTNRLNVFQKDDKSQRMQWEISKYNVIDAYNFRLPKGMKDSNTFLSCRPDGFVDMWEKDDSSGRQRFKLVKLVNYKDVKPAIMVRAEYSDKGYDQDPICLMDSARTSKWCVKFFENKTWFKIIFQKPVKIHFYTMTLANDFPGRDPMRWSVELNTDKGQVKEVHSSQVQNPARFAIEKFWLERPMMVSDIKFTYQQNRYTSKGDTQFRQGGDDGVNRLQLNNIGFWVPVNQSNTPNQSPQ